MVTVVCVLIIVIGSVFLWQKNQLEKEALEKSVMTAATFTPKGHEQYLKGVDNELATKNLSEEVKNVILYKKAIVMMDAVDPDESVREAFRVETGSILRELFYASTEGVGGVSIKENAILAYLLDFNQRFFLNGNTRLLPDEYREDYMNLYQASSTRTISRKEYQKLAFETYIRLANDPAIRNLARDTTFISNRMYTTAVYIDSFWNTLEAGERNSLLVALKSDIDAYEKTLSIVFVDIRHTKLVADFYYAYANDVYLERSSSKDESLQAEKVQDLYEKARKNVDLSGDFAETNLNMGQYINTYYLAFLWIAQLPDTNQKIQEVIGELDSYAKNETAALSIKSFYKNFLNTRGSWMDIRKGLVEVNKNVEEYSVYLSQLGIDLK